MRVEDKDIDAARQLRVQVRKLEEGKGKKKRSRWVCWGAVHGSDKTGLGHGRVQKKVRNDPGNDQSKELQRDMKANFRRQKREREADKLVDSEEEGDEGGAHLCFPPPPSSCFILCCAMPAHKTSSASLSPSFPR